MTDYHYVLTAQYDGLRGDTVHVTRHGLLTHAADTEQGRYDELYAGVQRMEIDEGRMAAPGQQMAVMFYRCVPNAPDGAAAKEG